MDLAAFTGISQFGPAYKLMYEHDPHAPGSVDCMLLRRMLRLAPDTKHYLYGQYTNLLVRYERGTRPELERALATSPGLKQPPEQIIAFCKKLGDNTRVDAQDLRFGGTEEQIIARGSDWCADVARVACVLFQVAGYPSRLAVLADVSRAYSGHVVAEVFCDGSWGVADPVFGIVYRDANSQPASLWTLTQDTLLVASHHSAGGQDHARLYNSVALVNYSVADQAQCDYTVTGPNEYTLAVLQQSQCGWPGGLRWLFNEDGSR